MSSNKATAPADQNASADRRKLVVSRTKWDIVIGIVYLLTGLLVLGDVVIASVVSVLFLGWALLIGGVAGIVLSLVQRGQHFLLMLISGIGALIVGLVFLRSPDVALVTLTLAIGAVFLLSGIMRVAAAFSLPSGRVPLIISGAVGIVLGLMIFYRWPTSALWLIGTLVGVQLLVDGLTMIFFGRTRLSTSSS